MAILVNKNTKVLVQGITGSAGSFHAKQCLAYGTQVVAGCTPNRGGETFAAEGPGGKAVSVPVFDTVVEAVKQTGADTSCIFVPRAGRGRRHPRSRRRGLQARHLHHRGHPGHGHDPRAPRHRRQAGAADRSELPRRHHARRVQDRHHAGSHPPHRQDRRRLALRHADLRSGRSADGARPRPVDVRRHRRRPGRRPRLRRRAQAVQRRPGHRRP